MLYIVSQDEEKRTQCSGVLYRSDSNSDDKEYYRILAEI